MAVRGPISHIDLSVSDPARSIPFYQAFLEALGFSRGAPDLPGFTGPSPTRAGFSLRYASGAFFGIEVRPASGGGRERPVDRYAPGLHHLAFHAESRADVDRVHEAMVAFGANVLDAPAEYPDYKEGYYAVFVADPDGLKLEVVYEPGSNA